jgi:hypothetical protein
MQDDEFRGVGERRSSSDELPIWLAERTRTSIMDEGSTSTCLTAGSSGGHHALSPSKSRLRVRKIPLACLLPSDLEDPVRHWRGWTGQSRKPGYAEHYAPLQGVSASCFGFTTLSAPCRRVRHRQSRVASRRCLDGVAVAADRYGLLEPPAKLASLCRAVVARYVGPLGRRPGTGTRHPGGVACPGARTRRCVGLWRQAGRLSRGGS